MSQITIRLELTAGPRTARTGLAALMLALAAPNVGSESVTMTTYYPAPSGAYTRMVTTGGTALARDGGVVSIGSATGSDKLSVTGSASVTANLFVNGTVGIGTAPTARDLTVAGNTYVGGRLGVGVNPATSLHVSGPMRSDEACSYVAFPVNGTTLCPAGQYATLISGLWVRDQIYSSGSGNNGEMLCCGR